MFQGPDAHGPQLLQEAPTQVGELVIHSQRGGRKNHATEHSLSLEAAEGTSETPLGDTPEGAAQLIEVHRPFAQARDHQATPFVGDPPDEALPRKAFLSDLAQTS